MGSEGSAARPFTAEGLEAVYWSVGGVRAATVDIMRPLGTVAVWRRLCAAGFRGSLGVWG